MEEASVIVNSVIQEMERAFDLTRRLQSLIKLGNYSEPLKASAKFLSEEVLQTCNTTLSALKSHEMSNFARSKKRKLQGAAEVRGRDLRSGSFVRKEVTAAPYDDGHQWRKYGEKNIKGCFFTRSYYRCTFSDDQRCQARKQVQRDPKDPTLFLVVYRGEHTCNSSSAAQGSSFPTTTSNLTSSGSPQPQDHGPFLLCFDSKQSRKRPETMMTNESENKFMISSQMNSTTISDENLSSASSCKLESAADFGTFIDQSEEALGGASPSDTCGVMDDDDAVFGKELLFLSSVEAIDWSEFDFDGIPEDFASTR